MRVSGKASQSDCGLAAVLKAKSDLEKTKEDLRLMKLLLPEKSFLNYFFKVRPEYKTDKECYDAVNSMYKQVMGCSAYKNFTAFAARLSGRAKRLHSMVRACGILERYYYAGYNTIDKFVTAVMAVHMEADGNDLSCFYDLLHCPDHLCDLAESALNLLKPGK